MAAESTMLPLGTEAPDFTLTDPARGEKVALAEVVHGARGLLVTFVCNHCPYVKHVARTLGRLAAGWAAIGVPLVAVNSNDPESYPEDAPDRMGPQAEAWGWDFPYLFDEDQSVARAYSAACTPDFFLFDADRRLVYRGRLDASRPNRDVPVTGDELDAAVRAVAEGRMPTADQSPSIGCSIKWR